MNKFIKMYQMLCEQDAPKPDPASLVQSQPDNKQNIPQKQQKSDQEVAKKMDISQKQAPIDIKTDLLLKNVINIVKSIFKNNVDITNLPVGFKYIRDITNINDLVSPKIKPRTVETLFRIPADKVNSTDKMTIISNVIRVLQKFISDNPEMSNIPEPIKDIQSKSLENLLMPENINNTIELLMGKGIETDSSDLPSSAD